MRCALGYAEEMLTKPPITQVISETGTVLEAPEVARDIVLNTLTLYSEAQPAFTVSSGLDGFLLKQMHAGMTPANSALEVTLQVCLASVFRFVGVFYLAFWSYLVRANISKSPSYIKEVEKKTQ
ncbi:hypothetical protein EON65_20535 [archaeon]|nr:MAG: hypothetical protein EON65_20535 [archaeon]